MSEGLRPVEQTAGGEVLREERVGVLEEAPADEGDVVAEHAPAIERVEDPYRLAGADPLVVRPEARGHVHEPGSFLGRHEVVEDDPVPTRSGPRGIERRAVPLSGELAAQEPFPYPGLSREVPGDGRRREHELRSIVDGDHGVLEVGTGGDQQVGGQGPRRRGPDEEVPRSGGVGEREADGDRWVGGFPVALRHLVRGQRRLAPGAVGEYIVTLLEQAPVEEGLERPPDALDVRGVHRAVGVVVVEPVPESAAHLAPDVGDGERPRPALLAEALYAEGLDLLLGLESVTFFDLELDRKAVAVPAGHHRDDAVSPHPMVAELEVLEHPGDQMAQVGGPVRGRRTLGEAEQRTRGRDLEGPRHHAGASPVVEHPLLDRPRGGGARAGLLGRHGTLGRAPGR